MVPVKIVLTVSCVAVLLAICASATEQQKPDERTNLLKLKFGVDGMEVLGQLDIDVVLTHPFILCRETLEPRCSFGNHG